jgi:malonyl-CoA decarboxylase
VARPNIAFLNELLQSIGASVGGRRAASPAPAMPPGERLAESCAWLMRRSGEASRIVVAEAALDAYGALDAAGKARFFRALLEDYSADPAAIRAAYAAWDAAPSEAGLAQLFAAVEPRRQTLLRRLNLAPGGTLQLVRMRADLLAAMRGAPELAPLDADFAHLLASWFNRGFLVMRRIDWNTPASILEKIVAYEAVHEIRDWDDLRRRLDPADRRCYGFFHPAIGDEPLIFVEVALCSGIPDAIGPLLTASCGADTERADTAVFYSISNCQPGLKGVSFGNFLIKQVARDLAQDLPQLRTFVTLSPAPGFAAWLAAEKHPEAQALSAALSEGTWQSDAEARARLAPQVQAWAARYFVEAKTKAGAPVDPVARFHLGNGAAAHQINWPADLAQGAVRRAHGLMINYLYELEAIEARHEAFVADGTIACGPQVRRALQGGRAPAA